MRPLNEHSAASDLIMKAVILWDDSSPLAKASALLLRVGDLPEVNAQWIIKSWRASALRHARIAEESLLEAADTHLVAIPNPPARSLPPGLREWLQQWAAVRQIPDAALAVMGDGVYGEFPGTVSAELASFALKHDLNLILEKGPALENPRETAGRFPLGDQFPLPLKTPHLERGAARDSYRAFGINE